jgi:hypothetical protein
VVVDTTPQTPTRGKTPLDGLPRRFMTFRRAFSHRLPMARRSHMRLRGETAMSGPNVICSRCRIVQDAAIACGVCGNRLPTGASRFELSMLQDTRNLRPILIAIGFVSLFLGLSDHSLWSPIIVITSVLVLSAIVLKLRKMGYFEPNRVLAPTDWPTTSSKGSEAICGVLHPSSDDTSDAIDSSNKLFEQVTIIDVEGGVLLGARKRQKPLVVQTDDGRVIPLLGVVVPEVVSEPFSPVDQYEVPWVLGRGMSYPQLPDTIKQLAFILRAGDRVEVRGGRMTAGPATGVSYREVSFSEQLVGTPDQPVRILAVPATDDRRRL